MSQIVVLVLTFYLMQKKRVTFYSSFFNIFLRHGSLDSNVYNTSVQFQVQVMHS